MDRDEITLLSSWLQGRVQLRTDGDEPTISFDQPTAEDFKAQGFGDEAIARTLGASWWKEMVIDIVETPEFAEPEDSPEQILAYARDVVLEYIRKRLFT
jgi:hypothetical protein